MAPKSYWNPPRLDWSTITSIGQSPSTAQELFATWLAQDSAVTAFEAECGNIPMPEAMKSVADNAGYAEALDCREQFNQLLNGRLNEMRTEALAFAAKKGSG